MRQSERGRAAVSDRLAGKEDGLMDNNAIQHVFVLMLENRSFDHMLGFSALSGLDAVSGELTLMNGLKGDESNIFDGKIYTVSPTADYAMQADPGHDFPTSCTSSADRTRCIERRRLSVDQQQRVCSILRSRRRTGRSG